MNEAEGSSKTIGYEAGHGDVKKWGCKCNKHDAHCDVVERERVCDASQRLMDVVG